MENKEDLSLSDFITEKLLKKERRPAFRRSLGQLKNKIKKS